MGGRFFRCSAGAILIAALAVRVVAAQEARTTFHGARRHCLSHGHDS